ncbi:Hypothetical_protein [Hexamita inflata]|uniref:Hypothetical_protein n=1 Tax=Hexamita inflata TaxID=28002 RepID=A0AA86RVP7_9EUKA|nr:Hypothetical protein HINF_LOCUS61090 [Hexamita inflata]
MCLRGTYHVAYLFINRLEINSEFFQEFSRLLMNSEILTDYDRNNFERVTILILFVPIMLLFESVILIKIPSDSNIQINLNSVDHNADVRFSPVFQSVVVVFADFSGLISLSEDSFKEVCKTIVGCNVQLVSGPVSPDSLTNFLETGSRSVPFCSLFPSACTRGCSVVLALLGGGCL